MMTLCFKEERECSSKKQGATAASGSRKPVFQTKSAVRYRQRNVSRDEERHAAASYDFGVGKKLSPGPAAQCSAWKTRRWQSCRGVSRRKKRLLPRRHRLQVT